jgi:hypothetical protein
MKKIMKILLFVALAAISGNAADNGLKLKFVNIYTISNHFGNMTADEYKPEPEFNESNENLCFLYELKKLDESSSINLGFGFMKNSLNNNSFYIVSEFENEVNKNIAFGAKAYIANGYDKSELNKMNIQSEYVIGNEYIINGGIFARLKVNDSYYIDTTLLVPGILTFNFGFAF